MRAWGVLGFAAGGRFYFLPTHPVVFRSSSRPNPALLVKFRRKRNFF
jgi:hypothetical protein